MAGMAAARSDVILDGAGQGPSDTAKSYEFHCGGRLYAISMQTHAPAGVRLGRFDFPDGPLPEADRRRVQAALDRLAIVEDVGLRCGETNYVTVQGFAIAKGNVPDSSKTLVEVFHVKNGRLVYVSE